MLNAKQIATNPDWSEPYRLSQGIKVGNMLFVSGQAATDEQGQIVGTTFEEQAVHVFKKLEKVLKAGGSSLEQVIKVTIFVTDMSHFSKVVELRERFFSPPYPADSLVEVSALAFPGLMIEIEAIALVNGHIVKKR